VVHPHDVFLLGVAVRYVRRAAAAGRTVRLVYDAREYLAGLAGPPPRVVAAYVNHEREFLAAADRVITVSEPIADELQRSFGLPRRPSLVLNAPIVDPAGDPAPSVRAAAGIPDGEPIVVYGGGLAHPRGVHTVVDALPALPGVHLVVVSRAPSHYTRELTARASELGCADRYHEVGFVDPAQVVTYFESATIGITPLLHAVNHDWALTNKFCEYVVAGLPIVTSDTEVQARLVTELGIGTVFPAGDVAGCAAAIAAAVADRDRYAAPLLDAALRHRFSWPAQADVLLDLYRGLLGPLPADGSGPAGPAATGVIDPTGPGAAEREPGLSGDETLADAPSPDLHSDLRGTGP
jgi:glycogen synthase